MPSIGLSAGNKAVNEMRCALMDTRIELYYILAM